MLHLITWLSIYTLILFGLNRVVLPLRDRRWFKLCFLPGTALAACVQALSARLCVTSSTRISLVRDREPAFSFTAERVPCLGGALFMLVSQAAFYIVYLVAAGELSLMDRLCAHGLSLPSLNLHKLVDGHLDFDFVSYLRSLGGIFRASARHPLAAGGLLYAAMGTFASLRILRRESYWALLMLAVLGAITYIAESFGVGVGFLSRGWWTRVFRFPQWWALFSLFVTLAGCSLFFFIFPRLIDAGSAFLHALFKKDREPGARKPNREKASANA